MTISGLSVKLLISASPQKPHKHQDIIETFLTLPVYIVMIIHIILIITITLAGGVLAVPGISASDTSKNQDDHNNETALPLGFKPVLVNDVSR
ncbi:hypothetical protein [Leclercia sp. Marseille-Q4284]|uniref:hypothetical protein n=1 Tax=Leclercia sp. Marseille-Q4284 TaxID=2866582 RepID=UPI001CE3FAD2|nr:hypothetical protein [Leclercia sp. Marseille-Q4284]